MITRVAFTCAYYALLITVSLSKSLNEEDHKYILSWNAPFLSSASGYGSEATSFLVGLDSTLSKQNWTIAAGLTHGDIADENYITSLSPKLVKLFTKAHGVQNRNVRKSFHVSSKKSKTIVIVRSI